jgi:HK97 gp10 family phage protein
MGIKVEMDEATVLVEAVRKRLEAYKPGDPRWREAVERISTNLVTRTVLNISTPSQSRHLGNKPLVDSGRLRRSIREKIETREDGVSIIVGSFGVPYARIHEFGTVEGGGTLKLARRAAYPPRPYLRPAFKDSRKTIRRILKRLFEEK